MASGGDIRYARCAGEIDVAYKVMGDERWSCAAMTSPVSAS